MVLALPTFAYKKFRQCPRISQALGPQPLHLHVHRAFVLHDIVINRFQLEVGWIKKKIKQMWHLNSSRRHGS